jgi:glutathione S-transferase
MKLIGMLDSPYVRRVAIALQLQSFAFTHEALSVFRTYDQFKAINPLVKAPTLVCDDGTVLMESNLIVQYLEALAQTKSAVRSLWSRDVTNLQHELRITGVALTAAEKSIQVVYEKNLRPAEKQHAPWLDRVSEQCVAAFRELELALVNHSLAATSETISHAGIMAAVAWKFAQEMTPDLAPAHTHPRLAAHSLACEALPEFRFAPYGDGVVQLK